MVNVLPTIWADTSWIQIKGAYASANLFSETGILINTWNSNLKVNSRHSCHLLQGCTSFPKILGLPQQPRNQKDNMKKDWYSGPTYMLCPTTQNLVTIVPRYPRFVHPWFTIVRCEIYWFYFILFFQLTEFWVVKNSAGFPYNWGGI